MTMVRKVAGIFVLATSLLAGEVRADEITCTFFEKEEGIRAVQITLQGDPTNGDPVWQAVTLWTGSKYTELGTGAWVGVAEDNPDFQVAEIAFNLFQWNGQSGLGISVQAAPILDGVSYGMKQFTVEPGEAIPPEPVWGVLSADGKNLLSAKMEVFDLQGVSAFLRLSSGYLNLPESDVPYGVDPETNTVMNALLRSSKSVKLDIYSPSIILPDSPPALVNPLVSYSFEPSSFVEGQAISQTHWKDARSDFGNGCPENLYAPAAGAEQS